MIVESNALTLVADVLDEAGLHDPDHTELGGTSPVGRACDTRVLESKAMIVIALPRECFEHVERT